MKNFIKEFKAFISRGNVIDMAIGIIIGGAFKDIVSSLVDDIINPIIGIMCGRNFDQLHVSLFDGNVTLNYGKFMTAVINFLIMAFVIFCFIKLLNKLSHGFKKKEEPKPVTTKKCPYCMSEIAIEATRCPHCTSELDVTESDAVTE